MAGRVLEDDSSEKMCIRDSLNSVRYGIGISGPIDLMSPEKLEIYRKRLMVAAKKIRREVELL